MIVFHIDVNNAYLSWEAVYRLTELNETLDLRTIPSVVGGDEQNRHGIVLAKSMPAKAFGIKTAETLTEARKKCPDILIVPPRHHLYRIFSNELIAYLRTVTPVVEQYSIDEAFADMTGCPLLTRYSPVGAAEEIRQEIHRRFGYTVKTIQSGNPNHRRTRPDRQGDLTVPHGQARCYYPRLRQWNRHLPSAE